MINNLIYLATAFTDDDPEVMEQRFEVACTVSAYLMQNGRHVFSPIAHGWPIAQKGNRITDWSYWEDNCKTFMSRCQVLYVVLMPGWKESIGVQAEIEYATEIGMPIVYLNPHTYEMNSSASE